VVIIINEDPVYVSWLRRHRNGFVLDIRRKPTPRNTMLHRATCPEIRTSKTKRTHWTTGRKMKACSVDVDELLAWAREAIRGAPRACQECHPLGEPSIENNLLPFSRQAGEFHLTGLGQDIVACVVEVAVIHLDDHTDYELTMEYVARYLSKSAAQLTAAVTRLVRDGLLTLDRAVKPDEPIPNDCRLFPTQQALRMLPAFCELSDEALSSELNALYRR